MANILFPAILTCCLSALPAQDGQSSFGLARTRELAELGVLPRALEVAVADLVNYHRHRLPLPNDDRGVQLDLRAGNHQVAVGGNVILQFGYTTAPNDDRADLPPLNLSLVIDCSGSMAEAGKLVAVQKALVAFSARLRSGDRVALVTYNHDAQLVQPSREVGDGEWLRTAIGALVADGYTNLHGGLMLGLREVTANCRPGSSNRVLLLTDGIANRGETNPERILADAMAFLGEEVDLSTIGVGQSLDVALLDRLARGGRGLFHFVADAQDVEKVFVREHEALVAPVARQVELAFTLPPELEFVRAFGHPVVEREGERIVALANLNRGVTGVVLVQCRVRGDLREPPAELRVAATLRYRTAEGRASSTAATTCTIADGEVPLLRDPEVRKNFTIARLADGMHRMAQECEARRWAAADRHLQSALAFAREQFRSDDDADVARVRAMAEAHGRVLRRYLDRFADF